MAPELPLSELTDKTNKKFSLSSSDAWSAVWKHEDHRLAYAVDAGR